MAAERQPVDLELIKTIRPTPDSVKPVAHRVLDQLGSLISAFKEKTGKDPWWLPHMHIAIHESWFETPDSEERARRAMCAAYILLYDYFAQRPGLYAQLREDLVRRGAIRIRGEMPGAPRRP